MRSITFIWKIILVILAWILSSVVQLYSAEEMNAAILDINIDYSNDPFYSELWFWILVAAFLLFLLILFIRGGRKKDKSKTNSEAKSRSELESES